MAFTEQQFATTKQTNNFVPSPDNYLTQNAQIARTDSAGNIISRSETFTDAGSFRYDFEGTTLTTAITGTLSFSNLTTTVTGVGTSFLSQLLVGQYIKLTADSGTSWRQIESIESNTSLTIDRVYTSAASGASYYAWVAFGAGTGATITNVNSIATLAIGTTASSTSRITRTVDYPAVVGYSVLNISQRIANQDIYLGFSEQNTATPRYFAWFRFNGTSNTTVILETCGIKAGIPVAADIETQIVTLPTGVTTASNLLYRIEVKDQRVRFFINEIQVGMDFRIHIPSNYDILGWGIVTVNGVTPPASNTNVNVDFYNVNNANEIAVYNPSIAEGWIAQQPFAMQFLFNQAGVIAINTDLLIIDCSQYRSLLIQAIAVGTTGVITAAFSNDGINYSNTSLMTNAGGVAATFNAAGLFTTKAYGKFCRLRLTTATTAGTTTLNVQGLQADVSQPTTQPISGAISGTVTANLGASSVLTNVGSTAQGASTYSSTLSNATTSLTQIKSGATTVNSIHASNLAATARYLKIFNSLSASVTMGATNANLNFIIPAGGSVNIDCGAYGIRFATGFTIAITAGIVNNDNTATGVANEVVIATTYF